MLGTATALAVLGAALLLTSQRTSRWHRPLVCLGQSSHQLDLADLVLAARLGLPKLREARSEETNKKFRKLTNYSAQRVLRFWQAREKLPDDFGLAEQNLRFGNLDVPAAEVARGSQDPNSFRLLESIGTDPKIYYRSKKKWVREAASAPRPGKENARG